MFLLTSSDGSCVCGNTCDKCKVLSQICSLGSILQGDLESAFRQA